VGGPLTAFDDAMHLKGKTGIQGCQVSEELGCDDDDPGVLDRGDGYGTGLSL
jgi:hypothetical protein